MNVKDCIYIGRTKAIIVRFYDKEKTSCEVVYFDQKGAAIKEDVVFHDQQWTFKIKEPCGNYADNDIELRPFINILKRKI